MEEGATNINEVVCRAGHHDGSGGGGRMEMHPRWPRTMSPASLTR